MELRKSAHWYKEAVKANLEIHAITKAGFFTRLKWLVIGVKTDHKINMEIEP
tara:strand:- start:743 stop:898 length:156 start_codon:yes stop_codon:yes gene_type:complete